VTEFGPGQASTRLGPCRVCDTIPEAERVQAESVAEALQVYEATVAEALQVYEAAVAEAVREYEAEVAKAAATYTEADATAWSDVVYTNRPQEAESSGKPRKKERDDKSRSRHHRR